MEKVVAGGDDWGGDGVDDDAHRAAGTRPGALRDPHGDPEGDGGKRCRLGVRLRARRAAATTAAATGRQRDGAGKQRDGGQAAQHGGKGASACHRPPSALRRTNRCFSHLFLGLFADAAGILCCLRMGFFDGRVRRLQKPASAGPLLKFGCNRSLYTMPRMSHHARFLTLRAPRHPVSQSLASKTSPRLNLRLPDAGDRTNPRRLHDRSAGSQHRRRDSSRTLAARQETSGPPRPIRPRRGLAGTASGPAPGCLQTARHADRGRREGAKAGAWRPWPTVRGRARWPRWGRLTPHGPACGIRHGVWPRAQALGPLEYDA